MLPKSYENPSVRLHSSLPSITDPEFPLGSWLHGCLGVKTQSVCLWHQAKRLHFLSPARPLMPFESKATLAMEAMHWDS